MRRALVGILIAALVVTQGCALPFRGTTTEVTITCNVPTARIRVDGTYVQAGVVELKRGDDHVVIAEAPGYRPGRTTIKSEASYGFLIPEAIFAFISIWFSVPLLVDAISGALYNLVPESVNVTLDRDEEVPSGPVGTQAPAPQNGRPAAEPAPSTEVPASGPANAPPPARDSNAPPPVREVCPSCDAPMSASSAKCDTCGTPRR